MAVAGMEIAEMAEDLALSGVLQGSGGVLATQLAHPPQRAQMSGARRA